MKNTNLVTFFVFLVSFTCFQVAVIAPPRTKTGRSLDRKVFAEVSARRFGVHHKGKAASSGLGSRESALKYLVPSPAPKNLKINKTGGRVTRRQPFAAKRTR
jgi:hypothetical protein